MPYLTGFFFGNARQVGQQSDTKRRGDLTPVSKELSGLAVLLLRKQTRSKTSSPFYGCPSYEPKVAPALLVTWGTQVLLGPVIILHQVVNHQFKP